MKVPDKIYVDKQEGKIITLNRVYSSDICYIRKNALLEWLESKVYEHNEDRFDDGFNTALGQVIDKLNSL